jgi:hypothetical protein
MELTKKKDQIISIAINIIERVEKLRETLSDEVQNIEMICHEHMEEADDDDTLNETIIYLQSNLKSLQNALDINQLQRDINYLNTVAKELYVKGEKE